MTSYGRLELIGERLGAEPLVIEQWLVEDAGSHILACRVDLAER